MTESLVVKDYSEYWGVQILLVRILQNSGLKVDPKSRLPIFRLWLLVKSRMTGAKAPNILQLLTALLNMRIKGMEPPNDGKKYV